MTYWQRWVLVVGISVLWAVCVVIPFHVPSVVNIIVSFAIGFFGMALTERWKI